MESATAHSRIGAAWQRAAGIGRERGTARGRAVFDSLSLSRCLAAGIGREIGTERGRAAFDSLSLSRCLAAGIERERERERNSAWELPFDPLSLCRGA